MQVLITGVFLQQIRLIIPRIVLSDHSLLLPLVVAVAAVAVVVDVEMSVAQAEK